MDPGDVGVFGRVSRYCLLCSAEQSQRRDVNYLPFKNGHFYKHILMPLLPRRACESGDHVKTKRPILSLNPWAEARLCACGPLGQEQDMPGQAESLVVIPDTGLLLCSPVRVRGGARPGISEKRERERRHVDQKIFCNHDSIDKS